MEENHNIPRRATPSPAYAPRELSDEVRNHVGFRDCAQLPINSQEAPDEIIGLYRKESSYRSVMNETDTMKFHSAVPVPLPVFDDFPRNNAGIGVFNLKTCP